MTELPAFSVLKTTPGILRTLLAPVTPEQMAWQPNTERWSINMVLAHLHHVEIHCFRSRFRAMVDEDSPLLPSYDQLALFGSGQKFRGPEELAAFERERSQTLTWLEALPPAALDRKGMHQELGPLTVRELLHEFAFHDLGHIRQIAELYRANAFYPKMGSFQKYYEVHP
jgi:hypothetical protein